MTISGWVWRGILAFVGCFAAAYVGQELLAVLISALYLSLLIPPYSRNARAEGCVRLKAL